MTESPLQKPTDFPVTRSAEDRRWCSDRRIAERRRIETPVAVERRSGGDRRQRTRRSGFDRRGDRRCGAYLPDASRCTRGTILRDSTGVWWCIEHAAFSRTAGQ